MNTDQPRQSGFEDRLLGELRKLVVAQPASGPAPPTRRWPASALRSRPRLALAGATVAVLAVGAAAGVPFLTGGAAPAYAVSTNDDGTVTVEISSLSDAAGLEQKLRDAGIRAVVQYLPGGKTCKQPWFTPAFLPDSTPSAGSRPAIRGGVQQTSNGHTRFTISRNLPADQTLVIMTQVASGGKASGAGGPTSIGIAFARGEVEPCEVVDATAGSQPLGPPPPGAGVLHTEGGTAGPATTTAEEGGARTNSLSRPLAPSR
jgi:hypothetical protein